MKRLRLAGLVAVALLVLVLVGSLISGLGAGGEPEVPVVRDPERPGERVRVEVLNAGGVAGAARAATDRLRDRGFDVVYYGNASGFGADTSWVLDRVGRPEPAERVADALDVARVRTAVDTALYVDVSVILGRDWAGEPADSAPGG